MRSERTNESEDKRIESTLFRFQRRASCSNLSIWASIPEADGLSLGFERPATGEQLCLGVSKHHVREQVHRCQPDREGLIFIDERRIGIGSLKGGNQAALDCSMDSGRFATSLWP